MIRTFFEFLRGRWVCRNLSFLNTNIINIIFMAKYTMKSMMLLLLYQQLPSDFERNDNDFAVCFAISMACSNGTKSCENDVFGVVLQQEFGRVFGTFDTYVFFFVVFRSLIVAITHFTCHAMIGVSCGRTM